jgi:hypothetical protein
MACIGGGNNMSKSILTQDVRCTTRSCARCTISDYCSVLVTNFSEAILNIRDWDVFSSSVRITAGEFSRPSAVDNYMVWLLESFNNFRVR